MERQDLIVIIGFTALLVLFLWYVFGKSPTIEQILISAIILDIGLSIKNYGAISKVQGAFSESRKFCEIG